MSDRNLYTVIKRIVCASDLRKSFDLELIVSPYSMLMHVYSYTD